MSELAVRSHNPATHAVTNIDHVPAHGAAEDEIVESGDAVQFRLRHTKQIADVFQGFVGNPTAVLLHDLHRIDAHRLASGIVRKLVFNSAALLFSQHIPL